MACHVKQYIPVPSENQLQQIAVFPAQHYVCSDSKVAFSGLLRENVTEDVATAVEGSSKMMQYIGAGFMGGPWKYFMKLVSKIDGLITADYRLQGWTVVNPIRW